MKLESWPSQGHGRLGKVGPMAWEPESVLRFALFFFAAQMLILWLLLPFAIYGIKKRLGSMLDQNRELYKEVSRLRRTLETVPGATRVGRRLVSAEEQKAIDEEEDTNLVADNGSTQARTEPPITGKKREGAASLVEQDNLPEEGDEEYEDYDEEPPVAAKPKKASGKIKKEPALPPVDEESEEPLASDVADDEAEVAEEPKKADKKKEAATAAEEEAEEETAEDDGKFADDSADYEDDSINEIPDDEELHAKLVDLPMKSKERKELSNIPDGIIVDIPPEDEISEDDEGYFIYRGEKFEHLIDAMRQQQIDAQAERADDKPKKKTG